MSKDTVVKRQVQEALKKLNTHDLKFVLEFLEFLVHRKPVSKPLKLKKPEKETPTQCIQRLRKTYPMLSSREMLGPTTQIMTEHMMEGVNEKETIGKLENLFRNKYQSLKKEKID